MSDNVSQPHFKSKKLSLILLAGTSIIFSRILFHLIADKEGPNLLIVMVLALLVYVIPLAVYFYVHFNTTGLIRLLISVAFQITLVALLYFVMK